MNRHSEITAEALESAFGQAGAATRFANFCNTVLVTESTGPIPSMPVLSEKPGPDGGLDGEWDVPGTATNFSNPFAELGWNVFQFKARGIAGAGRKKAVSDLKRNLKGALSDLVTRLNTPKEPKRYTLFTNLQFGLETHSTTSGGAVISKDRAEIETAIREGSASPTAVQILDAAQLAALVNKHPVLRLTYFTPSVARTWGEKWEEEQAAKNYKVTVPVIGRDVEIEQLKAWIADATVRAIAICGPSGMGKTRLALEATRSEHLRTTVVDVVEELDRLGLNGLGSSPQTRLVIVEDPTASQAMRLTKAALAAAGVRLIFTFPSEAKTPQLKLTEHASVKQIVLEHLDRDRSRKLLESAGTILDSAARDWVVQQAGGVPEILLSAAELGQSLRDKSGDLKKRLSEIYRRRIEKDLGPDAMGVLQVLTPLHWVTVSGENPDLPELISAIGGGMSAIKVQTHLEPLREMGYLRHRGDYVSVVPPLFAAALAEEMFRAQMDGICALFDRLSDSSRKRLLERAVTLDLADQSRFWDYVIGSALGTTERLIANLDLLDYLGRAIPFRTARYLETQIEAVTDTLGTDEYNWKRSSLLGSLRELAYQQESCTTGMRLLQAMALREPWEKEARSATKLFCECFVHWYTEFPLSFQERERWVRRMLVSENVNERRMAARIVVTITHPPHTLSAHSVTARRLGQAPAMRLNQEIWDYIDHALDLRFDLTQDEDSTVAAVAQEHFLHAFEEHLLPPDRLVNALEKFMLWHREGKLTGDEREIRRVVHWIERRFSEASQRPEQGEHKEQWSAVLRKLASLRQEIDEGPFEIRLKVALGRSFDHSWVEVGGKREYAFETRCRILAREAIANPRLMTHTAWALLRDPSSSQAYIFIIALGASDHAASFLSHFRAGATDEPGSHNLGLYLLGLQEHNAALVETQLEDLYRSGDFPKARLLKPIVLTGHTPVNRRLLLRLIANREVEPVHVGQMFTVGRWLEPLPSAEVRTILEYIATDPPGWARLIVQILSLYLHPDKALPIEVVPVASRALRETDAGDDSLDWDSGQVAIGIAKTDIDQGFALLRNQIASSMSTDGRIRGRGEIWTPLSSHGANDFWEFLRKHSPERAYRELLTLQGTAARSEVGWLLDLESHRELLLAVADRDEVIALFYANLVSGVQAGFFAFAYSLMQAFPNNEQISMKLASTAGYGVGLGFGDTNYSQALDKIETELKSPATPPRFLAWLENIKARINSALKSSQLRRQETFDLGWD